MKISFYTIVWRHSAFLLCMTTLLSVSLLSNILHFTLLSNNVPNAFAVNSKYQQRAVSRLRPAVILLILLTEVRVRGRYAARCYHATGLWARWFLYVSARRISTRIFVHSMSGMQCTSYYKQILLRWIWLELLTLVKCPFESCLKCLQILPA